MNYLKLTLLCIAALLFFNSCSEDDDNEGTNLPEISKADLTGTWCSYTFRGSNIDILHSVRSLVTFNDNYFIKDLERFENYSITNNQVMWSDSAMYTITNLTETGFEGSVYKFKKITSPDSDLLKNKWTIKYINGSADGLGFNVYGLQNSSYFVFDQDSVNVTNTSILGFSATTPYKYENGTLSVKRADNNYNTYEVFKFNDNTIIFRQASKAILYLEKD
jgi:hypothetical protein